MNRVAVGRRGLLRFNQPVYGQNRHSFMGLNFGTWWNGDAGWHRRIRGQGPDQHKKYDWMDFKDRPDIAKRYPFLYSFILRRQRDQAWGRKYFPIFPDVLFYLRFFMLYPFLLFWFVKYLGGRKSARDFFRKTLTRDREMEETFMPKWKLEEWLQIGVNWLEQGFGWFMKGALHGRAVGDMNREEVKVEETYLSDFTAGHAEFRTDRYRDKLIHWDRELRRSDGESTSALWIYGKLPLRIMSSVVGTVANWPIPVFMRSFIFGAYTEIFGVNMEEAVQSDYRFYPSLNAFFPSCDKARSASNQYVCAGCLSSRRPCTSLQ